MWFSYFMFNIKIKIIIMKKEEKENLMNLYREINKYPNNFAYVFTTSEDFKNPTIIYLKDFSDLVNLINSYEFRKISYKITSKSKFIWVDIGNYE